MTPPLSSAGQIGYDQIPLLVDEGSRELVPMAGVQARTLRRQLHTVLDASAGAVPDGRLRPGTALAGGMQYALHPSMTGLAGLFNAGHILKPYASFLFNIDLGPAFSNRHEAAHSLLLSESSEEQHPNGEKNENRDDPRKYVAKKGVFDSSDNLDTGFFKSLCNSGIYEGRDVSGLSVNRSTELAGDELVTDYCSSDLSFLRISLKFAVRN